MFSNPEERKKHSPEFAIQMRLGKNEQLKKSL